MLSARGLDGAIDASQLRHMVLWPRPSPQYGLGSQQVHELWRTIALAPAEESHKMHDRATAVAMPAPLRAASRIFGYLDDSPAAPPGIRCRQPVGSLSAAFGSLSAASHRFSVEKSGTSTRRNGPPKPPPWGLLPCDAYLDTSTSIDRGPKSEDRAHSRRACCSVRSKFALLRGCARQSARQ